MGGIVGDWNLRFGRFDLAKQPAITGSGASPGSLESDLVAVRTTAQCSSPARLVQSVRDDTRERDRACGLSLPAVEEWGER